MAVKHKTLYLYLALACFVGIIVIFVFDGYIGVYDTLDMDNGQYRMRIEPDQWDTDRYGGLAGTNVDRGGRINFTYTVENHRFSTFKSDIQISLYYLQEKVSDVYSGEIEAAAFNNGTIDWSVNANEIVPAVFPSDQAYNAYILLKRGDVEHRINIYVNPSYPVKTIPVPAPD
jgi:ABC-type amino acid transport substrate-binding protein